MESEQADSGQFSLLDDQNVGFRIFPARILNRSLQLTTSKAQKLLQCLKCPICLSIMENPVYLQCSHRFCKECLQKYIRKNQKKSCPNCRGLLATKRDLRIDLNLISIIKINFGEKVQQKLDVEISDKKEPENIPLELSKSDSSKIKEYKEFKGEPRKRIKQNVQIRKVTRSTRQRQKLQQKEKLQNTVKNLEDDFDMDAEISKEDEIWQQPIIAKKTRGKIERQKSKKQIPSKQQIPSSLKNIPSKNSNKQQLGTPLNLESVCSSINHEQAISISDEQVEGKQYDKQLMETQALLQEQLGPQYLKKLLEIASDITCVDISIQRFGNLIRIPQLPSSSFKMSLNTTINDIKKYIADTLNIKQSSWVKLIINNRQNQFETLDLKHDKLNLFQINELYWKNYQEVKAFDMTDLVNWLNEEKQKRNPSSNSKIQQRVLYYAVQYTI